MEELAPPPPEVEQTEQVEQVPLNLRTYDEVEGRFYCPFPGR